MQQKSDISDKVERVEIDMPPVGLPPMSQGGGGGGGLKALLLPVAISVALSFLMLNMWAMPQLKDDYNKRLDAVFTQITGLTGSVNSLLTLSTQISQIENSINGVRQDVATLKGGMANYATSDKLNALSGTLTAIQSDLNSVKSSLSNITSQVTVDAAAIKAIQSQLATAEAAIKTLQTVASSVPSITSFTPITGLTGTSVVITGANFTGATAVSFGGTAAQSFTVNSATQITAIVGSGSTGGVMVVTPGGQVLSSTTFTFTGTATGQLAVTLSGNPFTGSQVLTFSPIAANTTSSQPFSFVVANNAGKSVTNIQLAIGLQLLDASSNVLTAGLPSGSTVSLTSPATMTMWTQQSTGIASLLVYTNSASTGIFGGIGVLSQNTGTTTYTMTVTITTSSVGTGQISIIPMVKVVSYS